MRPIDGDILLEQFRTLRDNWDTKNATHRAIRGAYVDCILRIQDAPTVETEPVKHGRWINKGIIKNYPKQDINKYYLLICSECGCMYRARKHESGDFINSDFCPKCGAKMDMKDGEL